jgi:exopolyphosphatase/guanosine-5'-triphosphate,3'-diphosphate pyrophosphatase
MRVAGIDIGTNTILMLIADIKDNGELVPVADFHSIARLGEGLNHSGIISETAIKRALQILDNYVKEINKLDVENVFCVGTSALREAKNSKEVVKQIEEATGIRVNVIDGEFEAFLSFIGTVEDEKYSVLLDIGGGSTEVISGEKDRIVFRVSFPFGAVKLTEEYFIPHPPSSEIISKTKQELFEAFSSIDKSVVKGRTYAVAGTPTTIVAVVLGLKEYDRNKVDGYVLTLDEIRSAKSLFLSMSVEEISRKLYVPPLRADVITAGTVILESFCEFFTLPSVIVSDKGLRYGVIKYYSSQLLKQQIK